MASRINGHRASTPASRARRGGATYRGTVAGIGTGRRGSGGTGVTTGAGSIVSTCVTGAASAFSTGGGGEAGGSSLACGGGGGGGGGGKTENEENDEMATGA